MITPLWQTFVDSHDLAQWFDMFESVIFEEYHIFKEMASTPQDAEWHPEGNAWQHTKHVCIAMHRLCEGQYYLSARKILLFAALLHDIGKPSTTVIGAHITSRGHAEAGIPIAKDFLNNIGIRGEVQAAIITLIAEHMAHVGMGREPSRKAVKRLVKRLTEGFVNIEMWRMIVMTDYMGRPPRTDIPDVVDKIYAEAFAQQCEYDGKKLYEV